VDIKGVAYCLIPCHDPHRLDIACFPVEISSPVSRMFSPLGVSIRQGENFSLLLNTPQHVIKKFQKFLGAAAVAKTNLQKRVKK